MESFYQKIQALKQNPATSKAGSRWSTDEVGKLMASIKAKKSFKDIAKEHQRTEGSITSKLLSIGESMVRDGKDINEVSKLINLPVKDIQEQLEKNKDKPVKKIAIKESTTEDSEVIEEKKEIILTEKQKEALEAFKSKKNIFLTGVAGAGKSVTIKSIIDYCLSKGINFGVTATTGTAAFLIGGKTLHSYLGIGLAKDEPEVLLEKLKENKMFNVIKKLRQLDALIIDEISMLDIELFNKISQYISLIRRNKEPFGGIQVILTGDFCQLEPVEGDYCFKSEEWKKLDLEVVYLKKMIRQNDDKDFQKMLMELRYGYCSEETLEKLQSLKKTEFGEIKPTKLYAHNFDVDKINQKEYNDLLKSGAKKVEYEVKYDVKSKDKEKTKKWVKNMDIPETIELCIGAQIVVLANLDQDKGIVNGTRGKIIELLPNKVKIKRVNNTICDIEYHKCINSENPDINVSYMPLKLAYALTIHRSQGMTLDALEVDIGNKIFAAGQAYTALSRARNLKSVKVIEVSPDSFITRKSVIKFYKKLENSDNKEKEIVV
jgi:ATP-dependent DNA helicase PIF1